MKKGKVFRNWGVTTIIAVYLLILVGGIVRATGAGMGCPDWPKCFGTWIPPTAESQLPENYKEIFGAKLKGEVIFNPIKTWIEYANRLVGVLIGLFIFGTFITAFLNYRKTDKVIVWISFLTFLLVGFEGWLGSVVVSTELHTGMITLHMLVAILIVALLLYIVVRSYNRILGVEDVINKEALNFLLIILLILSMGQVILGTQVRESVDDIMRSSGRNLNDDWLTTIGGQFYIHLGMSIVLVVLHAIFYRKIVSGTGDKGLLNRISTLLLVVVVVEVFSGSVMALFDIPAVAQPIHLLFGVIVLGIQFTLFLLLNREYVNGRELATI